MPKVLCTLPNASDEISGVKFSAHEKGMLSEDVSDDVAAVFASIPGYVLVDTKPAGPTADELARAEAAAAEAAAKSEAERAALLARAEAAGLKAKATWGLERLTSEVEAAEKAKAEADAAAAAKAE